MNEDRSFKPVTEADRQRALETDKDRTTNKDRNPDPITGAPGAHPVGTGIGATGGGAAGAAIGAAVGGPVGAAVGIAVGAVAGGLAGKGAAESVNPTAEDAYWRENYNKETYVDRTRSYDEYAPAYRTGYEGYARYGTAGKRCEDCEEDLRRDYEAARGQSRLTWEEARPASEAAWRRVERGQTQKGTGV